MSRAKKRPQTSQPKPERTWIYGLVFACIVILAFYGRTAGLFRELDQGCSYHPDEPKQVVALHNYLEDRYIWYNHSLFYDGYPFFLNHFDEWIIRGARSIQHVVHNHFTPGNPLPPYPNTHSLYYWARFLRAVYGTIVVILMYSIARLIGLKRITALAAMLFQAIAPLSIAVSHGATGDIGVDFFSTFMILCVALYFKKQQFRYLFMAGIFIGFGFSAKYQGALMVLILMTSFMLYIWLCRKKLRTLFAAAGITLVGTTLGIMAAIPQLTFAFNRSWSDIRDNFIFIAQYGVDDSFLEQPYLTRLLFSMTHNPPRLIFALGWTVVLVAFAGLILSIIQLRTTYNSEDPNTTSPLRPKIMMVSLFVFPLLTGLISLSGKPAVQTIHFAYVQMPVCMAAAFALQYLWDTNKRLLQVSAVAIGLLILGELGVKSIHELYFWYRPDMKALASVYSRELCKPERKASIKHDNHKHSSAVRHFHVETAQIPVFRNRPRTLNLPDADLWQQLYIPPTPTIPWAFNPHWILMDGPVFPRNDRYVIIPGRDSASHSLVFTNKPNTIQVGVRCGYLPSYIVLKIGNEQQSMLLTPYEQRILSFTITRFKEIPGFAEADMGPVFTVPIKLTSDLGDVWATFMMEQKAVDHFRFYGGDESAPQPDLHGVKPEQVIQMLDAMQYLQGEANLTLDGSSDTPDHAIIQEERFPLACGVYKFIIEVNVVSPNTHIAFNLQDRTGLTKTFNTHQEWDLEPGLHTLTYTFSKPFAPFECMIEAACSEGYIQLRDWTLAPDTEQMLSDLSALKQNATQPKWHHKQPDYPEFPPVQLSDVAYANGFTLNELRIPDRMSHKEPIQIVATFDPNIHARNFEEYYIFLHFIDNNRKRVGVIDFPVFQASFDPERLHPVSRPLPDSIPPGEYTIYAGIWNGRTEQRVDVESTPPGHPVWKNKVPAGKVIVTP